MSTSEATVLSTTRRWVQLLDDSGVIHPARSMSKATDLTVGDRVTFESQNQDTVVTSIIPRRNELRRQLGEHSRVFATNVDLLLIVTAGGALFNTTFVDRALAAADLQDIKSILVINKSDVATEETENDISIYETLGVGIIRTSAKTEDGLNQVRALLEPLDRRLTVLCGISGVGKSSLLNVLLPNLETRTGDVSERTGQGRQTTTQANAYQYPRKDGSFTLLVDLPGFQNFGLSHLNSESVAQGFREIAAARLQCKFGNCSHRAETDCAVKRLLQSGEIAPSRYQNYLAILAEIEAARPY